MSSAASLIAGVLLFGLVFECFRNVGKLVLGIFMDMVETRQYLE